MKTYDLLAIVGQTASGKSQLALKVSNHLSAEIICADSKTIYKGLDIGTAKPTLEDRRLVKHHFLDICSPTDKFSVAQFQRQAQALITKRQAQNILPILVGGSGLYVDSVLFNYQFIDNPPDFKLRRVLSQLTQAELLLKINQQKLPIPENFRNKRYLIRTLERANITPVRQSQLNDRVLVVGLKLSPDQLEIQIRQRLQVMLDNGVLEEVQYVLHTFDHQLEALKGNIYLALKPYFKQQQSLEICLEDFVQRDLKLAKKQLTWFKRNPHIKWFNDPNQALDFILSCNWFTRVR